MTPEETKTLRDTLGHFTEINRLDIQKTYDIWAILIGTYENDPNNLYLLTEGDFYKNYILPRNATPEEITARAKVLASAADKSFGKNMRKKVTK